MTAHNTFILSELFSGCNKNLAEDSGHPADSLSTMNVFVSSLLGDDSMSMDENANIYVSHTDGITAFDPNGNKVLNIPLGAWGSNNVFAVQNNKLFFITGPVDRVTAIKMNGKGVEKF